MKTKILAGFAIAALVVMGGLPTNAKASQMDHKTIITSNAPLEIPGRVLAAGTYVLETLPNDPNIVQIRNEKSNRVVATLMTVRDERSETPSKTVINLSEGRRGSPEALHSWFYPGQDSGWEFMYPQHSGMSNLK